MKPLIVGVDPGSTSAVAAIDLEGEIQLLESGKNFPPREIIQRIVKVGKPVVVTSDRKETPSKVEKIGRSTGARIFKPEKDLSGKRKKELGKGSNSHEIDAVASAVHARKQLRDSIRKIDRLDDEKDLSREKIAKGVLNRQIIEKEETEEEKDDSKEIQEKEDKVKVDREKQRLRKRIENLEEHVDSLEEEVEEKRDRIRDLESMVDQGEELEKDQAIRRREDIISEKNNTIEQLELELEKSKTRESQYIKLLEKMLEEDFELLPVIERAKDFSGRALTRDRQLLEKLEKQGEEIYHIEDIQCVEAGKFAAVKDIPEKGDLESVIEEYRRKR